MRNKTKKSLIITSSIGLGIAAIATTATLTACSKNNKDSSKDFFIWNGNEITGITDEGKQQTNLVLPARATSIANNVFMNNTTIQSVDMSLTSITTIPGSVDSALFSGCENLTSVILPTNLTSIGDLAFSFCSSLTSINIPNGVTSIGTYAFWSCTSLTSINIPSGVTSIEAYAFADCSNLTSVTLPDSLTSVETWAFSGCTSLTLNIPNILSNSGSSATPPIGNQAFRGVKQVNVPRGNTTLENLVTHLGGYTGTIGYY